MTSSVVLITFRHFNCVGESAVVVVVASAAAAAAAVAAAAAAAAATAAGRNDYMHGTRKKLEKERKNRKKTEKVKRCICAKGA